MRPAWGYIGWRRAEVSPGLIFHASTIYNEHRRSEFPSRAGTACAHENRSGEQRAGAALSRGRADPESDRALNRPTVRWREDGRRHPHQSQRAVRNRRGHATRRCRRMPRRPAAAQPARPEIVNYRPYALLAELTYSCPLHCPYCSNPVRYPQGAELGTDEWARVFDEAAKLGVLHLGLSGGEPLSRADLVHLVAAARQAGLYSNLITSAIGLDEKKLAQLKAA